MFYELQTPWPQDGDNLFIEGEDWYLNSCLHFLSDDLGLFITGYKEAADRLVKSIMEDRNDQDSLVYPILFLYRHYLELSLKRLIREGNRLLDNPSPWGDIGFPTDARSHNLLSLWDECKKILEQMGAKHADLKIPDQDLKAVSNLLAQFSQQDSISYAARYPTDKKNSPSFPNLDVINVRNLAEVMEKIAAFFDAENIAVSVHLDFKQEMRQNEHLFS